MYDLHATESDYNLSYLRSLSLVSKQPQIIVVRTDIQYQLG